MNGYKILKDFISKLKPTIISRYIIKEQFPPMLLGVLFFTLVLVVNKVVVLLSLLIEKNVPFRFGLELFSLMLPFTLALTIPIAVLLGTIMAMGRLSSDSEIVAMRASGISYFRIYKSLFLMGFLYTVFLVIFNNYMLPFANNRYRILYDEIYQLKPVSLILEKIFFQIPGSNKTIYVGRTDKQSNILYNIIIYQEKKNGGRDIIIAKHGKWLSKGVADYKTLRLFNGQVHIGNRDEKNYILMDFSKKYMDINLWEKGIGGQSSNKIEKSEREKSIEEIYSGIHHQQKVIEKSFVKNLKDHFKLIMNGNLARPVLFKIKKSIIKDLAYRKLEFWKHLTIPLACLALTMIGAPLGIVSHRSGRGMGLGFAVIISFTYYFIMMSGERAARALSIPSWLGAWLPVVSISLIGLILIFLRNWAENIMDELGNWLKLIKRFFSKKAT